jgi:glutamate 5-kinase
MRKKYLHNIRRIVVKVGTSVISSSHGLSTEAVKGLVKQILALRATGKEIVLVSSGAIAAGMSVLGFTKRPSTLPQQQACAAIGQGRMMSVYEGLFNEQGMHTAQILLTREDIRARHRYLNSRNTLLTLLRYGIFPIVNENDTVSVDEIKFGDNDMLSSLVSVLVESDLLIILSDVKGLYTKSPEDKDAKIIGVVEGINSRIQELAKGTKRLTSVGGMASKIKAAKIATLSGIPVVIADGAEEDVLLKILSGADIGTLFVPEEKLKGSKKRWLLFGSHPVGTIIIDEGAKEALVEKGKSLLPSGILNVMGSFESGKVVGVADKNNNEIGRGIAKYSSKDIEKIKGLKTNIVDKILGFSLGPEVIHRDDMGIY